MRYYQQVSVDLVNMVYTAVAYLALAGAVWLFLRLIQACFWLPNHMRRQNDVQQMLQSKDGDEQAGGDDRPVSAVFANAVIDGYERYIEECERKENAAIGADAVDKATREERRKERQECLDMLKTELKRIQDGGDPYDFDYLLDDETRKLLKGDTTTEIKEENEEEKDVVEDTEKVAAATVEEDNEPKKDK